MMDMTAIHNDVVERRNLVHDAEHHAPHDGKGQKETDRSDKQPPSRTVRDAGSCGGRKSNGGVDIGTGWTNDLPITDTDRADSVVAGDEPPRLSGGKAKAEFNNPRPHKEPAAIQISRILRVLPAFFALFICHSVAADMPANL